MIYLLRHGEAEESNVGGDAARRLTEKGERQARDAGLALAALGVTIEACLASPKVRARQTARLACEALGVEVEVTEGLRGGAVDALVFAAGRGGGRGGGDGGTAGRGVRPPPSRSRAGRGAAGRA